jgi:pimeloyl-ACP methyl ester carboxylesterase
MTAWYDLRGEGPPVVLLHAGLTDSRMWAPQVESFTLSHRIANRLASGISGATRATIAGAAHLPNLDRPEEFDRIVLGFLAANGV